MLAYKFLTPDGYGLLSGFQWPRGRWVAVEGPLMPSLRGIHACRVRDLPYWLDHELWTVELGGWVVEGGQALVASRGRLVERVEAWDAESAQEFTEACAERNGGLGAADPDDGWVAHAGAAYVAAHAAGLAAERAGAAYESGFSEERAWQSSWLTRRLGLRVLESVP